jgi:predicted extracellular nuclease
MGQSVIAGELFVAAYNVENLFHPTVDPTTGDDDREFTPTGNKQWTESRLQKKIANLASVIKKMNCGAGPDILGLCEVENGHVVKLLCEAINQNGREYAVVHQDSPSGRGIDCAIVYDRKKVQLTFAGFHAIAPLKTRDIVEAAFLVGDKPLTVFMNHWPSQTHPPAERERAAKILRRRINQLLTEDAQADFVAIGDFNDRETADSLLVHLGAVNNTGALSDKKLFNTMAAIAQTPNRGTYVYQNKWETIDHVFISQGLLNPAGLAWKTNSTTEVRDLPELIYTPSTPGQIPRPNRTFTGNQYHPVGISDHMPVTCVLVY